MWTKLRHCHPVCTSYAFARCYRNGSAGSLLPVVLGKSLEMDLFAPTEPHVQVLAHICCTLAGRRLHRITAGRVLSDRRNRHLFINCDIDKLSPRWWQYDMLRQFPAATLPAWVFL